LPEVLRVKINWSGFVGSPGYTNFHFTEFVSEGYTQEQADACAAKVQTFITSMKNYLPATVTLTVDTTVDIIQTDTGNLVGFFTVAPGAAQVGTNPATYAAAAGACISWGTNGVRNSRRVRGRTFIVPLASNSLDTNGSINDSSLTGIRAAAAALIANVGTGDLSIWARPTGPEATDGVSFPVETYKVNDKVAMLTSRRD